MRPRETAKAINDAARAIRRKHPDQEHYVSKGMSEDGLRVKVRKSHWPEDRVIEVPTGGQHRKISLLEGADVVVGFEKGRRSLPFLKSVLGGARGAAFSSGGVVTLVLGEWMQSEANPLCNRGARDNLAPFDWANAGSQVYEFHRYYSPDDEATVSGLPSNMGNKFSVEDLVLAPGKITGLVSLFSEDDASVLGYLTVEYDVASEAVGQQWLHVMGSTFGSLSSVGGGRKQGYLFYDNISNVYTGAFRDGLAHLGASSSPTVTAWEASYGNLPPESSVSVAWQYALQGAHIDYVSGVSTALDCAVHVYSRSDGVWMHVAKVQLTEHLTTDYVRPCGLWDQFSDPESGIAQCAENARWPWAWKTYEWLVWTFGRSGGDTPTECRAKLLGINGGSGSVRTVHDLTAPVHKLLPKESSALQADVEAIFAAGQVVNPDDWVSVGAGKFQRPSDGQILLKGVKWINPSTLETEGDPAGEFTVDYADRPPDAMTPANCQAIRYSTYSGNFNTDGDPSVAPDCPKLACGHSDFISDEDEVDFPRGIVDRVDGRAYIALREAAHLADGTAKINTYDHEEFELSGVEDFTSIAGDPVDEYRVYKLTREITSAGFSYPLKAWKPVFRVYGPSGLEASVDLTRTFTDGSGNISYKEPLIYEYGTKGVHLYVLAADWISAEESRLHLLILNRLTLVELDKVDLTPGTGRSANLANRPQLLLGEDGDGVYAEVVAIWTDPTEVLRQVCRYADSDLTVTATATLTTPDNPSLSELRSLTLRSGEACWIRNNTDLFRATP